MFRKLYLIVLASLAMSAVGASAQSATVIVTGNAVLAWNASTTHTDGTPVVAANMTYHVHSGPKGVSPKTYLSSTAALTSTVTNQVLSQCFEVYAIEGTTSSVASTEVCMPNMPSPVTVTLKLGT